MTVIVCSWLSKDFYIGDNNLVWIIVAKDVVALFCSSKKINIWLENGHLKVWHMGLTYATSWQAIFIPCRDCFSFRKEKYFSDLNEYNQEDD